MSFKGIGEGSNIFFIEDNIGFYIKEKSTKYEPVFTEFKNIFQVLKFCNSCKKFPVQIYGLQFFWVNFH